MSFEVADMLAAFGREAADLLQEMESRLLELQSAGGADESIDAVFRAVHTIKGSASLFGLADAAGFSHVLESVLDRLRAREIDVSADLVAQLLTGRDHLADLLQGLELGQLPEPSGAQRAAGAAVLARLQPYLPGGPEPAMPRLPPASEPDPAPAPAPFPELAALTVPSAAASQTLHLSLRFGQDTLRQGMDPLAFLRHLGTLGRISRLSTIAARVPDPDEIDAEACYLGFELDFRTEHRAEDIAGVFDYVRDGSDIRVLTANEPIAGYADLVASYGEQAARVQAILVAGGTVPAAELTAALGGHPIGGRPAARTIVPQPRRQDPIFGSQGGLRLDQRPSAGAGRLPDEQTIRVQAGRLDRLVDVVGELMIAGAGARLCASMSRNEPLESALDELMRLVADLRDSALQLRMIPIGSTFNRFQRLVRDVGADLGKEVRLVISGGETEVDKALAEQIADPLTHLVRNALDHGIEPATERLAAGKPGAGTMRLHAFHDSAGIVIEVSDDGAGIDTTRLLAKAIERGLVEPGANLPDQDVHALIFEPGFSTAPALTSLSGRGVGMDVVKQNVAALRGTVEVVAERGRGCTVRLRLPLTLAIIEGFLVGVGGSTFVVPLDRVLECLQLPGDHQHGYLRMQDRLLPLVRLRTLFAIRDAPPRREHVVVVEHGDIRAGLVVDSLKGEFQTVIKPLGELLAGVAGIGGSTILGNGDVALIIDVPTLVRHASSQPG